MLTTSYRFGRPVVRQSARQVADRLPVAPSDYAAVMLSMEGPVYSVVGASRTFLYLRAYYPDWFHDTKVKIKDLTLYVLAPQNHFINQSNIKKL